MADTVWATGFWAADLWADGLWAGAPTGPVITAHPQSASVTESETAQFTVAATGASSYQWQRSTNGGGAWSNVTTGSGGTTAAYTTVATTVTGGNANNADQYRVVVTNAQGDATSNAATLTVNTQSAGSTGNWSLRLRRILSATNFR